LRQYTLRRLSYVPIIVIAVSLITFFTLRLPWVPDPVIQMCGMNCTVENEELIRESMNLDKPVSQQFVDYIRDVVTFDFGRTFRGQQPVASEIFNRLPVTIEIMFLAMFFTTVMGVTFGVLAAVKQNSFTDYGLRFFAVFGQSIPDFFLLVLLIVLPSLWWNYSPPVGGHVSIFDDPWTNLRLYVPPAFVVALSSSAILMRVTRSSMLEVLRQDYVRTARAKGLGESVVILSHSLRNALVPIITIIGSYLVALFFGSVIIEIVFSINGVGQFLYTSALAYDFPVMQFLVLYSALVIMIINLLIDLSYALLDPRVKYS
jgi:peptide/nickel transport system permease protein